MPPTKKKKPFQFESWIEHDLTAAALEGKLSPVFGLDEVIRQVDDVLAAEGSRSPVLVGPTGVGKTVIVHAIVQAVAAGRGPRVFNGCRVVQLGFRGIISQFSKPWVAAGTVQKIFDHMVAAPTPIVPFIRDIHLAEPYSWESLLVRLCSRLGRPILAEGNTRGLQGLLDSEPELAEWLIPIPVDEPSTAATRRIVAGWAEDQRQRTGRAIAPVAQRAAIDLTGRFIGNRHFPRKALDLLRESRDVFPGGKPVGMDEVLERFTQSTRVPRPLIDPAIELDLEASRRCVAERLLGQEEAVDAVVRVIALIKAGLSDPRRPFGVFLFVGPTGVGKTHTAQLLAEYFFGDRARMIRINLGDFTAESSHAALFGHPSAQSYEGKRGELAKRLGNAPFGVLLFDELEKAHASVHDGLLQLIDEGRYINGAGETVSARSLILIATSNAGAEVYRETGVGFAEERDIAKLDRELDRRLQGVFRFEFLNRFDRIVHFHPLSRATIRQIAQRELRSLADREGLASREIRVEVDADVLDWLVAHGYHPHFGARFLRRELERSLVGPLAGFIVAERVHDGETLAMGVRGGRIDVRRLVVASAPEPPALPEPDIDVVAAIARWQPLVVAFEDRKREAQALLEESARPGFWSDPVAANTVLSRYRALDARIAADARLLASFQALHKLPGEADPGRVAATLRDAEAARQRWQLLDEGSDEDGAFVVLGPADVSGLVDEGWLQELLALELAWLSRQGLSPEAVAEELHGERVVGVAIEVDGPGVANLLAMEAGVHRRRRKEGEADRLLVEVLPRRPSNFGGSVSDARHASGTHVETLRARLAVTMPHTGQTRVFVGTDRATLSLLGASLARGASRPTIVSDHAPARAYYFDGVAVRDLRTGAYVVQPRELKKGALEPLRRAWDLRANEMSVDKS